MIGTARSLPLEVAVQRPERVETTGMSSALSRREATLRSAATTCLSGIALVQAIELPSLFVQGRQFGVLALAAMAMCMALGLALAAAPERAASQLWRAVAAAAAVVLAGWAVPRAVVVPGLDHHAGHWTSMPGGACAAMAGVCLGIALVAARPGRAAVRGLAVALAVTLAMAPPVGVMLVSLGPGLTGGETVLASGGHLHAHGSGESAIIFQPGPNGGRYVYRAAAAPHQTVLGVGLIVAAAVVFTYGAVGYLRGRSAPAEPVVPARLEGGLA